MQLPHALVNTKNLQPPIPILILPAINSANPANTTIFVSPSAASPAVRANGTVKPSLRPNVKSEIVRGSIL